MYCTECIIDIIQNVQDAGSRPVAWLYGMAGIVSVEFTTSEYCEYVLHRMYYRYHTERPGRHGYKGSHFGQYSGGLDSLNRISASISGTSAGTRPPRGGA